MPINQRPHRPAAWIWPLGLAAAFTIGFVKFNGYPNLPPHDADQWLPVVIVPAGLMVAIASAVGRVPRWLTVALWLLLALVEPWILLRPLIPHALAGRDAVIWAGGLGICAASLVWAGGVLERRATGPSLPLSVAMIAAVTGGCIVLWGWATVAGPMIALAAGLLLVAGLLAILPKRLSSAGSTQLSLIMIVGTWVLWLFYVEPEPLAPVACLAAAVPAAWLAELPVMRHSKPWQSGVVRVVVVAIPLAIAIALTLIAQAGAGGDSSGY